VKKLAAMPEVDGGTVLDHTAMVMTFEAGIGTNPVMPDEEPISAHSNENMVMLVAGRAGGLKSGIHVRGNRKHPAAVIRTAMQAVGVDRNLGDITDSVPELLT
jgi:hypothetical protein